MGLHHTASCNAHSRAAIAGGDTQMLTHLLAGFLPSLIQIGEAVRNTVSINRLLWLVPRLDLKQRQQEHECVLRGIPHRLLWWSSLDLRHTRKKHERVFPVILRYQTGPKANTVRARIRAPEHPALTPPSNLYIRCIHSSPMGSYHIDVRPSALKRSVRHRTSGHPTSVLPIGVPFGS